MIIIVLKYSEVPYVSEIESLKTIQTYFSFLLQSFVLVDYSMSELCVLTLKLSIQSLPFMTMYVCDKKNVQTSDRKDLKLSQLLFS